MDQARRDHHGSHRHLIAEPSLPGDASPGKVDAVVVPTIRHPRWLQHAARLAAYLECPLVSLNSKYWSNVTDVLSIVPRAVELAAVFIEDARRLNLPDFATDALLRRSPFSRSTDLSAKRNLGLVLARVAGWRHIVFLDDDIKVGAPQEVARAAALLDIYDAVGMRIGGYPDNSVVCHAYRVTGGRQESFVGGGALVVQTIRNVSFFPNVYNEDWFYLLGEKELRSLAVTGTVAQRPYDPFDRAVRARDQEFGDVLAEGIYWLLDERSVDGWMAAADRRHWERFLAQRKNFIEHVRYRVRKFPGISRPEREAMESSLRAALGRLSLITPDFCVAYLHAWMDDRIRWEKHLDGLSHHTPELGDALKYLVKRGGPALLSEYRYR
ncbi:hypothetical protein [Acrocarpospora phusangensis]|uniref:hypothetical protein n=1 Tax=Acrocarpospora phusangensis TaxID=1070424 RepID=UPI00195285E9|nr:hypothetical protein [Acrocarpospora phusangensis]